MHMERALKGRKRDEREKRDGAEGRQKRREGKREKLSETHWCKDELPGQQLAEKHCSL